MQETIIREFKEPTGSKREGENPCSCDWELALFEPIGFFNSINN